jgi:hypothetical protein
VPAASSTVGHIVKMAHRLDMTWLELDPSKGIMFAAGDGHHLSSVPIRGLRLALRYHNTSKSSSPSIFYSRYIPTPAVDAMHCGKVLLDPNLYVERPYALGPSDASAYLIVERMQFSGLGDFLPAGTKDRLRADVTLDFTGNDRLYQCAINDYVALKSPFLLPQPCYVDGVSWPLAMKTVCSVFAFLSARYTILYRLRLLHQDCACTTIDEKQLCWAGAVLRKLEILLL